MPSAPPKSLAPTSSERPVAVTSATSATSATAPIAPMPSQSLPVKTVLEPNLVKPRAREKVKEKAKKEMQVDTPEQSLKRAKNEIKAKPKGSAQTEKTGALRQWRASDLRGLARLAAQATTSISHMAEGVHQSVLGTLGLPGGAQPGQTRGLTGWVYQSIRGVTRLADAGLQAGLARLEPFFVPTAADTAVHWEREAILAALNGVMGDRLQHDNNPLCTLMGWYQNGVRLETAALGRPLNAAARQARPASIGSIPSISGKVTGKLLVLVHGLCMNDLQWQHEGHDHGAYLAEALGYTPVYLRYNTGLHTSTNGAQLSALLESLVAAWPAPVTELAVLAHSMGGLVARSACEQAAHPAIHSAAPLSSLGPVGPLAPVSGAAGSRWLPLLRHLVFLGTPHHGAPLERAGHWVETLLGSTPYSRPFERLARLRSAGITDLRYGHVLDADWHGRHRFHTHTDQRAHVPLPAHVVCCAVAATLAAQRSPVAERLVGDGLVPLHSALGLHDDPQKTVGFAKNHQAVFYRLGHLALLSDERVARQVAQWLQPASQRNNAHF